MGEEWGLEGLDAVKTFENETAGNGRAVGNNDGA